MHGLRKDHVRRSQAQHVLLSFVGKWFVEKCLVHIYTYSHANTPTHTNTHTHTHTRTHTQVINDSPIQLHVSGIITEYKRKMHSHLAHRKRAFAHWPPVRSFAPAAQMRAQNTLASYHDKQQCPMLTHSTRLPNGSTRLTLRALRPRHGFLKTTETLTLPH